MASLERMLVAIDYQRGRDTLWLTGDLVNRGPRSLDVLHWARSQGDAVITILGNHDLHLLARASGVAAEKKRDTLDAILHAPDRDELIDWVRTRPFASLRPCVTLQHSASHVAWNIGRTARGADRPRPAAGATTRARLGDPRGPVVTEGGAPVGTPSQPGLP